MADQRWLADHDWVDRMLAYHGLAGHRLIDHKLMDHGLAEHEKMRSQEVTTGDEDRLAWSEDR